MIFEKKLLRIAIALVFLVYLVVGIVASVGAELTKGDICSPLNLSYEKCDQYWALLNNNNTIYVYEVHNYTYNITNNLTCYVNVTNNITNNITAYVNATINQTTTNNYFYNYSTTYNQSVDLSGHYSREMIDEKINNIKTDVINSIILGNVTHILEKSVSEYLGGKDYVLQSDYNELAAMVSNINNPEVPGVTRPGVPVVSPLFFLVMFAIIIAGFIAWKFKGNLLKPNKSEVSYVNYKDEEKRFARQEKERLEKENDSDIKEVKFDKGALEET